MLVVVYVDDEKGILQVRERTTLEHISQLGICLGMSTQKVKAAAALIAVFPRVLYTVA